MILPILHAKTAFRIILSDLGIDQQTDLNSCHNLLNIDFYEFNFRCIELSSKIHPKVKPLGLYLSSTVYN